MRVVLDLETYYDDQYSLERIHTLEYVRDERFQIHGAAVKVADSPTRWIPEADLKEFLDGLPDDVTLVCHNTYFDGLALFHHYGYCPHRYADTLSMARGVFPLLHEYGLDYLARLLSLGEKIPEVLGLTKGVRELPPDVAEQLAEYAINDVDLTAALYEKLAPALPEDELELIHLTIRWGAQPTLHVDIPRIVAAYREAVRARRAAIKASGSTLEVLSSQPKFKTLLESLGVEVPLKKNKKGKLIPALGKDDIGFRAMMADYPEHKLLFAGRLAAKSTITHTRIRRVYSIGKDGTLPMPLKYYGAHTGRWSGADGLNPQNFTRGSELRKSIIAPPGYVILVADQKQIEARINMWFCNEQSWLEMFASGRDVYTTNASVHFGVPYEEVTPEQRFFGKILELGLGYGMGWRKFRVQAALRGTFLTEAEAYSTVQKYRDAHRRVCDMWGVLNNMLYGMYQEGFERSLGPLVFGHECIRGPNDMSLNYDGLTPTEDGDWFYGISPRIKKIYGGAMLENIIQYLARVLIGEQILGVEKLGGIHTVSSTHDEIIALVREKEADEKMAQVTELMCIPPEWAPGLPLGVDIGYAKCYSK